MRSGLRVKNKIESDKLIKAAVFKKDVRVTAPHKHNSYFEIIYLSKGKGYHFIDSRKFTIKPPVLYFIRKEQVHHWNITSEPSGYVVIIKKSFIEKSLDGKLKQLFSQISKSSSLQIKENGTIENLFQLLVQEGQHNTELRFSVIEGLIKSLLAKILEVARPLGTEQRKSTGLYQSFLDILNQESAVKNSVAYYAKKLNASPQNLNSACRKAVDQTAAQVLSDFIISEAKRLLIYSDKTISEIAFDLDFADPSHFVKYFKRIADETPNTFRSNS